MKPTDQQLQLALAKMLPDILDDEWEYLGVSAPQKFIGIVWRQRPKLPPVLDTEWLHVCHLAEQELSDDDYETFADFLGEVVKADPFFQVKTMRKIVSATWQQRAEALCKMNGITP